VSRIRDAVEELSATQRQRYADQAFLRDATEDAFERLMDVGLDALTPAERVVCLAFEMWEDVVGSGFRHYLTHSGTERATLAADALREAECDRVAWVCREARTRILSVGPRAFYSDLEYALDRYEAAMLAALVRYGESHGAFKTRELEAGA
jgi:hypothetical protein